MRQPRRLIIPILLPAIVACTASSHASAFPPLIAEAPVRLDPKESEGVKLAEQWKNHPDLPRRSADGSVNYLYSATLPSLVCSPLEVSTIRLEPGEIVSDLHAGDTARWRITPAVSGEGEASTTYLVVKPTDAGLQTNLFITTNRRSYVIRLISTQNDWIPMLSFDYPEDVNANWNAYAKQQEYRKSATTLPTGQNLVNLDFGYRITGDKPAWRPERVYTDGVRTFIQFPVANFEGLEAPTLVTLSPGGWFRKEKEELVNYRLVGDRYIVDQVIDSAALITGVGKRQVKVVIERSKKQ